MRFFFGVYDFLLNFIATGVDVDIFCFGYLPPFFFMGIAIVFFFLFLGFGTITHTPTTIVPL